MKRSILSILLMLLIAPVVVAHEIDLSKVKPCNDGTGNWCISEDPTALAQIDPGFNVSQPELPSFAQAVKANPWSLDGQFINGVGQTRGSASYLASLYTVDLGYRLNPDPKNPIIIGIGAGYGVKGAVDASKLSGGVSAEDAQNLKLSGAAKVYVSGVKYGGFFGVIRNPDERAGKGAWNLIFGLNVLTNRIAGGP